MPDDVTESFELTIESSTQSDLQLQLPDASAQSLDLLAECVNLMLRIPGPLHQETTSFSWCAGNGRRFVQHQPIHAQLRHRLDEFGKVDRLSNVAVGSEGVPTNEVLLLERRSQDDD